MSEEAKAEQLSDWLGVQVQGSQVVLSHTPFKQLVPALQDKPVLVSGMGHVVHVARHYGFRRTITTKQIARMLPTSVPSALDSGERLSQCRRWYLTTPGALADVRGVEDGQP